MTLQDLCKYYISCIELENNTTLRVSLKNPTSFTELPFLNDAALKMSDIAVFLDSNREKENDLLIGFPILKVGEYLSPVFILHLTYNDGSRRGKRGYSIDSELAVNKDIIDRYSTNEKNENIFELRQLETELGIATNTNTLENLLGVVTLLRSIRPNWESLDDDEPESLEDEPIVEVPAPEPPAKTRTRWSTKDQKELTDYYKSGMNIEQLAKYFNHEEQNVIDQLHKLGLM